MKKKHLGLKLKNRTIYQNVKKSSDIILLGLMKTLIQMELVSGSLLKSGSHQQSGSTHRIVTALVQKKEMTTTFFKKMEKVK